LNIRLQQINPTIGDLSGNKELIIEAIQQAEAAGKDLLILPELCVCGYPPMDLLERGDFLTLCGQVNDEIISAAQNTTVIFGTVTPNQSGTGRKMFNSAVVARGGRQKAVIHKALLPTYDVFDDLRYFEPNMNFEPVEIGGIRFGVTVCEDIWYNENEFQYHHYDVNPAMELVDRGAQAIINISASPFTKTKPVSRLNMLKNHARQLKVPVFYCNQVGANTELVFDGATVAVGRNGDLVADTSLFVPDFVDVDFDGIQPAGSEPLKNQIQWSREKLIFHALKTGLNDYLEKTQLTSDVVLGLSGGIDSALVCTIAADTLGSSHVHPVTMPSQFSSSGSVTDSGKLAERLNLKLETIPVKSIYESFMEQLEPVFKELPFGVAEENLQSRARGNLLMAIANKFGYMLLNTSNKSELAVGYGTLYGDMAGGLGLIADLYKTEVYALARWLNREYFAEEIIPDEILSKAPSAELRPGQKDTDTLPEYEVLDEILKYYLEDQKSPAYLAGKGFEESTVHKVINLIHRSEHKRFQSPPAIKVSAKAFGTGRRWPIVQQWTAQTQKASILLK